MKDLDEEIRSLKKVIEALESKVKRFEILLNGKVGEISFKKSNNIQKVNENVPNRSKDKTCFKCNETFTILDDPKAHIKSIHRKHLKCEFWWIYMQ